ncbi:hypothetical protein B5F53_03250 [Blautia sp. An249]|uniref:DUF7601 domain-containing protein n=1 Tax=Blautia sp. An249 TaxID=1965603 RepID=UPI000B394CCA|nr:DUF5979 domain-containing protein [Blautia sp. An249]OUO80740.1 hypothetical protein B5F53_03250 [Blautia sp. An249]
MQWYRDGAVVGGAGNILGSVNPDVPRYDADNPGERMTGISGSGNFALKAVASENTKKLAQSQAKLVITGNHAQRGGGIGANGAADMGEEDQDHTLCVKKEWSENTPEDQKTELTVFLKIGEYELDAVKLNQENNWMAEFTQLPNPDSLEGGLQYAVVENPVPDHFQPVYQEAVVNDNTISVTITNQYEEPKGNLTVSKVVAGNAGDIEAEFTFTVTLEDSSINGTYGEMEFENGVSVFTLKHGESKTAENLPAGIGYEVQEAEANADGYETEAENSQGSIPEKETAAVTFTNTKEVTGNLTVSKIVAGNAGDMETEFTFTLTLEDSSINGTYGEMEFENGVSVFTLKHGESKTAENLPAGIGYEVQEAEANADGYETEAENSQGSIPEKETASVIFTNTKEEAPEKGTGNLIVSKLVTGDAKAEKQEFTFTVTLDDKTVNGKYGEMEFEDGVSVFTLKHGESKQAENLKPGMKYTVKESDNEGYKVTAAKNEGSIEEGKTVNVIFHNEKEDESGTPGKTYTPSSGSSSGTGTQAKSSSQKGSSPKTGDTTNLSLWITLLCLSGFGLTSAALLAKKKR